MTLAAFAPIAQLPEGPKKAKGRCDQHDGSENGVYPSHDHVGIL